MAIKMTKEEYEAKFGVKPPVPSATSTTTKAPIKMTKAEYEAKFGVSPETSAPAPEKKGALDAVKGVYDATLGDFFKGAVVTPALRFGQAVGAGGLKLADKVSGGAVDRYAREKTGQSLDDRLDYALSKESNVPLMPTIKGAPETYGEAFKESGGNALKTGAYVYGGGTAPTAIKTTLGGKVLQGAVTGATAGGVGGALYGAGEGVQEEDADVGSVLARTAQYGATGAVAGTVLGGAIPAVGAGARKVFTSAEQKAAENLAKNVSKRENELMKIESGYANLRKAQEYNPNLVDSRKRIAGTDVLVDAVDENGVIRTKGSGGAVQKYKEQTIDNAESVVMDLLNKEGSTVNAGSLRKKLREAVLSSNLPEREMRRALEDVDDRVGSYVGKYPDGNIPLTYLQGQKIKESKLINYQTPPEKSTLNKAYARGIKEVIEENSNYNIKEVNSELAKYYKDLEYLELLDGKRVKGGKLGKYFARIAGNIGGGIVGTGVGGVAGGALGTFAGGELSERILQTMMKSSFGNRTGANIPKSKILDTAVKEAGSERLALPAPKEGAPQSSNNIPIQMGAPIVDEAPAQLINREGMTPLPEPQSQSPLLNRSQSDQQIKPIQAKPNSIPSADMNTQSNASTKKSSKIPTNEGKITGNAVAGAGLGSIGLKAGYDKLVEKVSGKVSYEKEGEVTPETKTEKKAEVDVVNKDIQKFVPEKYKATIVESAEKYGIPPKTLAALLQSENGQWKEDFINPQGTDTGLGQHNDNTYKDINRLFKKEFDRDYDRKNGNDNIIATAMWLDHLTKQKGIKSLDDAIKAYRIGVEGLKRVRTGRGTDAFTNSELRSMANDKLNSVNQFLN